MCTHKLTKQYLSKKGTRRWIHFHLESAPPRDEMVVYRRPHLGISNLKVGNSIIIQRPGCTSMFLIRPHGQGNVNNADSVTIEHPFWKSKAEKDCRYLHGPCGSNRNGYAIRASMYGRTLAVTNRSRSRKLVERMYGE